MAGAKILVIEDQPLNLELVRDLLEMGGYVVWSATDAEEGLTLARTAQPDLILMDISLPGMDGLTATRKLKEDSATQQIPVVALTAHAMKGDQEKAQAAGCAGYLTKPVDTRTFVQQVSNYLKGSGRQER
ncbi:MAG: response regulator [Candidatus Latescibacteria bacterium]|nr:response regulator [Candidatus Latescibacterota bacterium]